MGGQGSGRPPSEETIIKRLCEPKTPIVSGGIVGREMFLPNHSGIAVHPEFKEAVSEVENIKKNSFCKVSFFDPNGAGAFNLGLIFQFNTITFHSLTGYTLLDPGSNYNAVTDHYVIPVSGYYKVTTKMRLADGEKDTFVNGNNINFPLFYGFGADAGNTDSPDFLWTQSQGYYELVFGDGTLEWYSARSSAIQTLKTTHFNKGQEIRAFEYNEHYDEIDHYFTNGTMQIELLYAD